MDNSIKLIDGKAIAATMRLDIAKDVASLSKQGIVPGLTVVIVGDDPASTVYVRNKEKSSQEVGMNSSVIRLNENTTQEQLLEVIDKLNSDAHVHGILVQLPLPKQINESDIINAILPEKDVDGFHPVNVGKLMLGDESGFVPCTPAGVIALLKSEKVDLAGKHVVVVGRSNIVGKPLVPLFLKENATVTVCHSKTRNLAEITQQADILVVAIGRDRFIKSQHVKHGVIVVDVGINRVDGKLYGDVDFVSVAPIASKITPVPGGVGPMTIAMLLSNTLKAAKASR